MHQNTDLTMGKFISVELQSNITTEPNIMITIANQRIRL